MISIEAYNASIGMFHSRLMLQKLKHFKALPSSTSRFKRKWKVFFIFLGGVYLSWNHLFEFAFCSSKLLKSYIGRC